MIEAHTCFGNADSNEIKSTQILNLTEFGAQFRSDMVKGKKTGKKKSGKSTSNVFSMFEQQQIQEFKEAFGMIDANRDGFIDKDDLRLIDY